MLNLINERLELKQDDEDDDSDSKRRRRKARKEEGKRKRRNLVPSVLQRDETPRLPPCCNMFLIHQPWPRHQGKAGACGCHSNHGWMDADADTDARDLGWRVCRPSMFILSCA